MMISRLMLALLGIFFTCGDSVGVGHQGPCSSIANDPKCDFDIGLLCNFVESKCECPPPKAWSGKFRIVKIITLSPQSSIHPKFFDSPRVFPWFLEFLILLF